MRSWTVTFRCSAGHEQHLHYGEGFTADMVHDHAVLVAGGTLRSLGIGMPGYPCAWQHEAMGHSKPCGAKVSFEIVAHAEGKSS